MKLTKEQHQQISNAVDKYSNIRILVRSQKDKDETYYLNAAWYGYNHYRFDTWGKYTRGFVKGPCTYDEIHSVYERIIQIEALINYKYIILWQEANPLIWNTPDVIALSSTYTGDFTIDYIQQQYKEICSCSLIHIDTTDTLMSFMAQCISKLCNMWIIRNNNCKYETIKTNGREIEFVDEPYKNSQSKFYNLIEVEDFDAIDILLNNKRVNIYTKNTLTLPEGLYYISHGNFYSLPID